MKGPNHGLPAYVSGLSEQLAAASMRRVGRERLLAERERVGIALN